MGQAQTLVYEVTENFVYNDIFLNVYQKMYAWEKD